MEGGSTLLYETYKRQRHAEILKNALKLYSSHLTIERVIKFSLCCC